MVGTIITGLLFCYFFMAGILFRDMIDDLRFGYWPPIGGFILSILWLPMMVWSIINTYCQLTRMWWIKFAGSIFKR
jgi:hypothetical protein